MWRRLARLAGDYYKWFAIALACVTAALFALQASFDPGVAVAGLYGWVCDRAPDVERVTGKACPASLSARPKIAEYQQRLTDFRVGVSSGEERFLEQMSRTGFKIRPADVCQAAIWLSERSGPERVIGAAAAIFERSIPEGHKCETGSWVLRRQSVSLPVVLLDRGLFPHNVSGQGIGEGRPGGCGMDQAVKYWPRQSAMIDRIIGKHGMPDDFATAVRSYLDLAKSLRGVSRPSYENACVKAVLADGSNLPVEFLYSSASCPGLEAVQRQWRLDIAMQGGASAEAGTLGQKAAERVCRGAIGLDLSIFEVALRRWDHMVLTRNGG